MSLEAEIVAWVASRPMWQQQALHQIAANGTAPDPAAIAAELAAGTTFDVGPLRMTEVLGGGASGRCVRLRSVTPRAHVNALLAGQLLTLCPDGITVVYGDNASGKSGYARILKQVVYARVREEILTDVFEDLTSETPSALIGYENDGVPHESVWPGEANSILHQVHFYDDACGKAYITHDTTVSYRPSTLVLFDRLVDLCEKVKVELDTRLSENTRAKVVLPTVPDGTPIHTFLGGLTGNTTADAIEKAVQVPAEVDTQITELVDEEARLRATDPTRERVRLNDLAAKLSVVRAHLISLRERLGGEAAEGLRVAEQTATKHRASAIVVSSTSSEAEPLPGIGSETWRVMWDAARRYSETEPYVGRVFPATGPGDRCVLCQQALSIDAGDRLQRFHQLMTDNTERLATESQRTLEAMVEGVRGVQTQPLNVAMALVTIETSDNVLAEKCRIAIEAFTLRKDTLLQLYCGESVQILGVPDAPLVALEASAEAAMASATNISDEGFQENVRKLAVQRAELEGRRTAGAARDDIHKEVDRLSERLKLEAAKRETDTSGITRKATELARDHVTAVILDRFTRESHDLNLERVTLNLPGGRKGQLMQRPGLLAAKQEAELPAVLSEGEQTALGLAGFLTEAHFDETKSAIVLDDPVTSLDHIRRARVASRLCKFAGDRQVIVFTHDVTFVGDIRRAADEAAVHFTERAVERQGGGHSVGVCREQHPWKARDAKARIHQLETDLARIKKERVEWDNEKFVKEAANWAGCLSETWERIISLEIVNQIVDKGTSEVRPKMFRILARITSEDEKEFQASYSRCSRWLRRHDKSPETNYVPPEVSEMEAELELVRSWYERIRKYSN